MQPGLNPVVKESKNANSIKNDSKLLSTPVEKSKGFMTNF